MSALATFEGKNGLKAHLSKNSSGFIVSVDVVVDKNTAVLIRTLRKSDTPISNGAKPTDIPAIEEKLALISTQELWQGTIDQKYAEDFAKKLLANIEDPNRFPDYLQAVANKEKKANHKSNKSTAHFDKKSVQSTGFNRHKGATVPPSARKSPGGARGT